jgi:hypothetical protein
MTSTEATAEAMGAEGVAVKLELVPPQATTSKAAARGPDRRISLGR